MFIKKCPGCTSMVMSSTGSETWHEVCWQRHHKLVQDCTEHAVCMNSRKVAV